MEAFWVVEDYHSATLNPKVVSLKTSDPIVYLFEVLYVEVHSWYSGSPEPLFSERPVTLHSNGCPPG